MAEDNDGNMEYVTRTKCQISLLYTMLNVRFNFFITFSYISEALNVNTEHLCNLIHNEYCYVCNMSKEIKLNPCRVSNFKQNPTNGRLCILEHREGS